MPTSDEWTEWHLTPRGGHAAIKGKFTHLICNYLSVSKIPGDNTIGVRRLAEMASPLGRLEMVCTQAFYRTTACEANILIFALSRHD